MTRSLHIRDLRDQVHGVTVGDDLVLLDVAGDAYLCLPDEGGRVRLDDARQQLSIADPALCRELEASGLVRPPGTISRHRREVAPPSRSALDATFDVVRAGDIPDLAWALGDLALGYWRRPLAELVAWAETTRPAAPTTDAMPGPALLARVARFHRWAPFLPAPGKCLLRSFLLLRYLRRHGHDAAWVFGVHTWPFRAHCWLQCGDMVLDDDVDPLVALTRILVV